MSVTICKQLCIHRVTQLQNHFNDDAKFKRKNKSSDSLSIRCNNRINMKSENKNNSYKVIDSHLKNEKVYKYDNGDLYKGEFIDGKRHGFGICIFANKEIYEGIWKNDLMHSIGKYTYNNDGTKTKEQND